MRVELDVDARRYDGGRVLVGGVPSTLMRLSAKGASTLAELLESGGDLREVSPAAAAFAERLVGAAMLHPVTDVDDLSTDVGAQVTVVVPARDRIAELDRCLRSLRRSSHSALIVVDDASTDATGHREVAERHGAQLVRLDRQGGPALARNAGLAEVSTEFVAFVDSDIEVTADWLGPLVALLAADRCDLVAPRIVAPAGPTSVAARYEYANSPLDMGPRRGVVVAGSRLSYVPAATLVARTSVVREVGGFDVMLAVGEDVDLVWRLAARGHRVRYEPASTVVHHHRELLAAMLARRVAYGTSAALLDERHAGVLAPVRVAAADAAAVGAAASGHPVVALAATVIEWRRLSRTLEHLYEPGLTAARLVARRQFWSWRQLARAFIRPWWPIVLPLAFGNRRMRRVVIAGSLVTPLLEYRRRRPRLDVGRWTLLWLADDAAYSAGVWWGCLRSRRLGPLLPSTHAQWGAREQRGSVAGEPSSASPTDRSLNGSVPPDDTRSNGQN